MDAYIKVEDCGDDFGSSVTSTVVSPLGHHSHHDEHMTDLGFDPNSASDFASLTLFDEKKNYFDPMAPMAEPVSTFHHNMKKEYNYEPVVTNIRAAAVVSSVSEGVSNYITSPVVTSGSSSDMMGQSPPPFSSNGGHYPGISIVYEHKGVESTTSPPRKYIPPPPPQKGYSPTKSSGSDQSFTAADSNSSSTTKSFVPCKVCGDKASGYHYGVTSCEGCKGFFRRSIQKKIEYRCLRDEKCLVIRLNRNRCQFCRFKKCLDVGMSRDSVRYGRVPKRSRERMEESRVTQSEADQSMLIRDLETKELAIYDLTLTVTQAHHVNSDYTELRTRGMVRKPAIFSLSEFSDGGGCSPDSQEQQKISMWQQFAHLLTPSIHKMVEFVKKIPGFADICQDDQLKLLKKGLFEVWVFQAAKTSNHPEGAVTFADGSYFTRQQIELIFDYEFMLGLFNFIQSINSMELNDSEIGLFSGVIILAPERDGMEDPKLIGQIQERLIEALKVHIAKHHPGEPNLFPMLMMKLSELRSLNAKHGDHLDWYRSNWEKLTPPPLFAETFDIPMSMSMGYIEDMQQ